MAINPYHPIVNRGTTPQPLMPKPAMPGMRAGGLMGAASTLPQLPRPVKPVTPQLAGTAPARRSGARSPLK